MFISLIQLIGGIILLLAAGKFLVKGSVELTKYFKISSLVVGMTVVAFGTSAPELLVSLEAAIKGAPDISLGNVIGSNISNIAFVLALTAVILPLPVQKDTVKYDMPIMLFSFLLIYIFMIDNALQRWEGLIFIILLIIYIFWEIKHSRKSYNEEEIDTTKKEYSLFVAIIVVILSSIVLAIGANFLIEGASKLAKLLGISERVISISIVAIGTSLPELTTSIIAAIKKKMDISIGNIVGSNVFNIFAILGTTALVKPIKFNHKAYLVDLAVMAAVGLLLWFMISPIFSKKRKFRRSNAIIMLVIYFAYIYWLFLNKTL